MAAKVLPGPVRNNPFTRHDSRVYFLYYCSSSSHHNTTTTYYVVAEVVVSCWRLLVQQWILLLRSHSTIHSLTRQYRSYDTIRQRQAHMSHKWQTPWRASPCMRCAVHTPSRLYYWPHPPSLLLLFNTVDKRPSLWFTATRPITSHALQLLELNISVWNRRRLRCAPSMHLHLLRTIHRTSRYIAAERRALRWVIGRRIAPRYQRTLQQKVVP